MATASSGPEGSLPHPSSVPLAATQPARFFLERFGLTQAILEQIVGTAIARRADYADLYFEFRTSTSRKASVCASWRGTRPATRTPTT
jgi:hypothetical protein